MDWRLSYTPNIWPSLVTMLALLALALYSSRRQNVPGARALAITLLIGAIWVAGMSLEVAAADASTRIFWIKYQALCMLPVGTAVTCFLLEYAWPGRWLTIRNLLLLFIAPLLFAVLILTDDVHHLMWRGFVHDGEVAPLAAVGNWMLLAYAYGLTVVNIIIFGWLFVHSPQHRWPVALMVAGQIVARVIFGLSIVQQIQAGLQMEVVGIWFTFPMYVIALFGFRIFDPIPLARQTAVEQLRDGMLVVDLQGRVASMNPSAERILEIPASRAKDRLIQDLIPSCQNRLQPARGGTELEIRLPARDDLRSGDESRHYLLQTSPLKDWRGSEVGNLLLLHDVTEQKRAQAQIIEQQRALGMLHEREQLARELHDSLGQVLGFASLKMEAVRKLIVDGKLDTADEQLARLELTVADAHADVREYILNLHNAPADQQPFFGALQHYLDGFCQNYGIQAQLSIGEGVDDRVFAPEAQMQIFRIIQEAFSNARKHAETNCVQISFVSEGDTVRVRIQDDGRGFDPQQQKAAGSNHFGLRFMRERAEQLGGRLRVESAPGMGTCVELEVPVKRAAMLGGSREETEHAGANRR